MELFRAKVKVRFFHPGAALDALRAKSKIVRFQTFRNTLRIDIASE